MLAASLCDEWALLDRLGEARRRHVLDAVDAHRARRRRVKRHRRADVGQRDHLRATADNADQQAAGRRRLAARRVPQIRATEHAEHHLAVLDECQTHRILFAAQKTLGAIDRIDGPEAALGAALVIARGRSPRERRPPSAARWDRVRYWRAR
jgi:hypothetical protein